MASTNGAADNYQATSGVLPVGNVGAEYGWNESYDPDIKTGTQVVQTPGTLGTLVAVRPGSIDVRDPSGKIQTLTKWNGQAVTRQVVDRTGKVYTFPAYGLPIQSVLQRDGSVIQQFELTPGTSSTQPKTDKATNILKQKALLAQSANPDDRKQFTDLQDRLIKAGLLDKTKYVRGLPDDATQTALHDALVQANRTKQTLDEVLQEAESSNQGTKQNKSTRNIQLTSPATIQQSVLDQAPGILGHAVDPTTVASLTAQYNALEAQQQNTAADTIDANVGQGASSMTYNQPSVSDFVNQQLRASDPVSAQGMSLGHYLGEFMALLQSGGSGTPNTFGGAHG